MTNTATVKEALSLVNTPSLLAIMGEERLSVGEGVSFFFKELALTMDKGMAKLASNVHAVNYSKLVALQKQGALNYVKDSGVLVVVPDGYSNSFGGMMDYSSKVTITTYLVSTLHTEVRRLYSWLKGIVKSGRLDIDFTYSVSDFDKTVNKAKEFIGGLRDGRSLTVHFKDLYVDYNEFFSVIEKFNKSLTGFKHRDVELVSRELDNVYDLGQLLVTKVTNNEITLTKESIADIQKVVNDFVDLTNVVGAMVILLNELSGVLTAQVKAVEKIAR